MKTKICYSLCSVSFVIAVVVYLCVTGSGLVGQVGSVDNIRYIVILLSVIIYYISLFLMKAYTHSLYTQLQKNFFVILILLGLLYLFSVLQAGSVDMRIGLRTYVQLMLLLIPVVYAFGIVNIFSIYTLQRLFCLILVIHICIYVFLEIGVSNFFNLNNFIHISFMQSNSPYESNATPGGFIAIFIFLNYFRHFYKNKTQSTILNICWIISFLFVLLTFKRPMILFALCVFFVDCFFPLRKKIKPVWIFISSLFFTVITFIYTKILKGEIVIPGLNLYDFTTGRTYILSLWKDFGFLSFGYGSSFELIGRYLEMDLVQMAMEIGYIAVFCFALTYFYIARNNFYSFLIIFFQFVNMLVGSSIPDVLQWTLFFVTIFAIVKSENDFVFLPYRGNKHIILRL